jgi:hypothetical protein
MMKDHIGIHQQHHHHHHHQLIMERIIQDKSLLEILKNY